jgi:acyl dehydratase
MHAPPDRLEVTAILDPRPRYIGTSHEDATARAMGYRAALIPGAFVYGHVTRLALAIWGEAWLARGRAQVRFRRPVFSGDRLLIVRDTLTDACGPEARVSVTDAASGAVVLDGSIGRAAVPPGLPPDVTVLPLPAEPTVLAPGTAPVGRRLGSAVTVLTPELVQQSLRDFHETAGVYTAKGLVHSGMLVRRTMSDALGNFALPMPVIFAGLSVQMLAPAPVGESYTTAARVVRAWERKGKHYFDSEEWLLAGSIPVARHIRTNLYAVDR